MHPCRVQQPELEVGQLGQSRGGDAEERAAVAEHRLAQYGQLAVQLVAALHAAAVTLSGCGEGVEAAGTGAGRRRWGEENTEKLLMGAVTW